VPALESPPFRVAFDAAAARFRARVALRSALVGAGLGLAAGVFVAAGFWATRHGTLRPLGAAGAVLGALGGYVVARRRRPSDEAVALFLDARLGSHEVITTALGLVERREGLATAAILEGATEALRAAPPERVKPRLFAGIQLAAPLSALALVTVSLVPLPPAPAAPPPEPGAELVKLGEAQGLDAVIALAATKPRDEAERARLQKLAKEAEALRDKLREGLEKREAQEAIAKLRDDVVAEKLSLSDGDDREGLEAALSQMAESDDLREAQKALSERDMKAFDEAMQELANRLEQKDRQRAKELLEQAAEAARRAGAEGLARTLAQRAKELGERGSQREALRELAKALGEGLSQEAKDALREMESTGDPKSAQALSEALEKALQGLSAEQRKRLAEAMKRRAEAAAGAGAGAADPKTLEEMARQLGSEAGQKQLEELLKQLADEPPPSAEQERQRALGEAERGLAQAERQLGGAPMPMAGQGAGSGKGSGEGPSPSSGSGSGDGSSSGGPGAAGPSRGGGPGSHVGETAPVDGDGIRAHAASPMNPGAPMPGMVTGRTTGRAGETANVRGTGALGQVGPGEVGAVDKSEVPRDYREQVGRYFEPK
jgi:hypothetical protein